MKTLLRIDSRNLFCLETKKFYTQEQDIYGYNRYIPQMGTPNLFLVSDAQLLPANPGQQLFLDL